MKLQIFLTPMVTLIGILAPRSLPIFLIGGAIAAAINSDRIKVRRPDPGLLLTLTICCSPFAIVVIKYLFEPRYLGHWDTAFIVTGLALCTLIILRQFLFLNEEDLRKIALLFFAGIFFAVAIFLSNLLFANWGKALLAWLSLDGDTIGPEHGNRPAVVLVLWLWPALLFLTGKIKSNPSRFRWLLPVGFYLFSTLTIMMSESETAKLALLTGSVVLLAMWVIPIVTKGFLWLGIMGLICFMPWTAGILEKQGLHEQEWLQNSARHRVIMWSFASDLIEKKPVLGYGFRSSKAEKFVLDQNDPDYTLYQFKGTFSTDKYITSHPHNAFVQIRLDLGIPGVVMLLTGFLALFYRTNRLERPVQPAVFAGLAASVAVLATGYGLWQNWLLCALAWTILAFGLSVAEYRLKSEA